MAEIQLTCRACGNQFIHHRRKAYCSYACRPSGKDGRNPERQPARNCEQCGIDIPRNKHSSAKFCSEQCRRAQERDRYKLNRPKVACVVCDRDFHPKGADRATCCSRECGFELLRIRANRGRVFHSIHRVKCKTCSQWGEGRKGAHTCKDCVGARKEQKPKAPDLGKIRTCRICAAEYHVKSKHSRSMFCSKPCKNKHNRAKPSYVEAQRQAKARRRARKKGCTRTERIGPTKVFERDLWRCGICGCKTLKSKRGTYHPRAPELDHIVSLANGGSHTWDNVQCSCRECNGRKGASDFGQMLMFPRG